MSRKVLGVYCAGGFGGVIRAIAEDQGKWEEIYYIDDDTTIADGKTILTFSDFSAKYSPEDAEVIITAGEPRVRKIIFEKVKAAGYSLPNIFSRQIDMLKTPVLGEGNIFFAFTSVAPNHVVIGSNNVFMTYARVGHDNTIGNHCLLATQAVLAGDIEMGDCAYVGIGAMVREQTKIGESSIVSMGAVVMKDVPESAVVMGNPAIVVKRTNTGVFKNAKDPNKKD